MSTSNAEGSGRLGEAITLGMIDKIHNLMMEDKRSEECTIVSTLVISNERVHNILHHHLTNKNLSANWVPYLLTIDKVWCVPGKCATVSA